MMTDPDLIGLGLLFVAVVLVAIGLWVLARATK